MSFFLNIIQKRLHLTRVESNFFSRKEEEYHCIDSSKDKLGLIFIKQFGFERKRDQQKVASSVEIIYVMYLDEQAHEYTTEVYTTSFNDKIDFQFEVIFTLSYICINDKC